MRNTGDRVPSALARISSGDILLPTVTSLRTNERILLLREENILTSTHTEEHRFQFISVRRTDGTVEFSRDLGPVTNYVDVAPLIIIPDGDQDTVDMVMDEADRIREGNQAGLLLQERAEESTMIEDIIQQTEEKRKRLLNQSQFSNADGKMTQRTGTHPKK
jgi:hypothetical protein